MWIYQAMQVISPRAVKVWVSGMFSYGFLRTMNADYMHYNNNVCPAFKLAWSTIRGCVYASPLGVYHLGETPCRAALHSHHSHHSQHYMLLYTDGVTVNKNVFV